MAELRAELFSLVSKADGKIKDVEKFTSETMLENDSKFHEVFAKEMYHWSLKNDVTDEEKLDLLLRLKKLDIDQKVDIVRSLWMVAISDHEIHPLEKKPFLK